MPDDAPVTDRSSNAGSFADFYEHQYAATVRLAAFLSGTRDAAEDLAQEAFLRLEPRFADLESPAAYLRSTVVNLCRNQHRSASREARRLVKLGPPPSGVSDRAAELDVTLRRLPYDERAVVVLRYWLGLTEAEIAAHLGCRPGTVKSRSARALNKIRKELP
jgi:DNA-directed RNA polymerase specialized sigma24 family protein